MTSLSTAVQAVKLHHVFKHVMVPHLVLEIHDTKNNKLTRRVKSVDIKPTKQELNTLSVLEGIC